MNSPEEVRAYLDRLKQTIQYIGVSDCDMEKGNLRVDLNVSLRKRGIKNLGIRREVKNLNSFRFVERALRYEVVKQAEILEMGNEVDQCTLLWDEKADRSYVIRSKEDAPDYRYFPDPDLPPVIITDEQLKHICSGMPELPADRENRFVTQFTLTLVDAKRLTVDRALADYFESVVKLTKSPVRSANWILGRLLKAVNESGVSISEFHITPDGFAELILLIENETITEPIAREVFVKMVETSSSAKKIVENEGLSTTSEDLVVEAIESIIDKHPHEVERFRNGEVKLKGFFIGQVMRATGGKADPRQLNMVLDEKLK
jgi:aspartyl-tRNA(Asn)/glutamyl-tRNA(Gln) amidotransferase subunit B